jgi:toxin ParE1/3/4
MAHEVHLTEAAARDLEGIHGYILETGSRQEADRLLDRILDLAESLAALPERGAHPRELAALGILAYRQVFFKPYRVIYQVAGDRIYIHVIADGRRDMQSLLEARLLSR